MAKIRDEKVYAQTYPKVEPRAKNINSKRIKSAIITDSLVISKEKSVNLPICGKTKSAKKANQYYSSSSESKTESYCTSSSDVVSF